MCIIRVICFLLIILVILMILIRLTILSIFIWPMILLYVLYLLYLLYIYTYHTYYIYVLYLLYLLSFLYLFYFTQISLITYNMWNPFCSKTLHPHTEKKNNPHLWHGWEWRAHSWDKHVPIGCYLGYLEENIPWYCGKNHGDRFRPVRIGLWDLFQMTYSPKN